MTATVAPRPTSPTTDAPASRTRPVRAVTAPADPVPAVTSRAERPSGRAHAAPRAGASPAAGAPGGAAGPAPRGPAGAGPGRGARRGSRGGAPAPRRRPHAVADLARGFAELFCEVEAGQRPRRQLEGVMSPLLAARLAPVWVRPGPRATLVAIRGDFVTDDRFTAVAVLRRGRRCGALALELERRRGTWTVTEAARPEDGELPTPELAPPCIDVDVFDLVCGPVPSGRRPA